MKIKNDFITNSSSTSYIFLTKEKNKRNIYSLLRDDYAIYSEFDLETNEYNDSKISCNVGDVISEMKKYSRKIKFKNIEEILNELEESCKDYKNENKENIEDRYDSFYTRQFYKTMLKSKIVEQAISDGFMYYLDVEFGDGGGCGIVEGNDVGKLLHWFGDGIKIFNNNLIIFTENHS